MRPLILGTRGSALALWQARHIAARLTALEPTRSVELKIIKTTGDKILDVPLAKIGGKGLFLKEIEEELLGRGVDLAVHSMKDVPADLPQGLRIAAVTERAEARDALVSTTASSLQDLASGARVGTSSLRRASQLRAWRSDLRIEPLRGNVDTRLRKLDAGEFDAVILAAAGLVRLGHSDRITELIDPAKMLPAIAQGALGIEVRAGDTEVENLVAALDDPSTASCVDAERSFLRRLGGGCQVPIGGHAERAGTFLQLDGLVARPDGSNILRGRLQGSASEARALGRRLAENLLAKGADEILRSLEGS